MIVLRSASRWYGEVIGLNDVTCEVGPGVTALLGMNGAGKSTMLKLITGQIRPTTGEVLVDGLEPFANAEVCRRLGYCPEIDNFYEHMSGREFVRHMARLSGFDARTASERADEMLERVGMTARGKDRIAGYSKGMRQRIKLAQAMLHDPPVILLDEPLNGLDPGGRREFMGVLAALAAEGRTVLISSHILFEVEQMTRAILLLHRGRLLATGDLRVIRTLIDKHPHRVRIESPQARAVAEALIAQPFVLSVEIESGGEAIVLETREADKFYDFLPTLALDRGIPFEAFTSPDNNLEAVFQYLVNS